MDTPQFNPDLYTFEELCDLVIKLLYENNDLHSENNCLRIQNGQQADEIYTLSALLDARYEELRDTKHVIDQFRVLDVMRSAAVAVDARLTQHNS